LPAGTTPLTAIAKSPTLSADQQSALALAVRALSTGESGFNWFNRLSDLASAGDQGAGAILTPSGQFTTSAPEILRDIQFPNQFGFTGEFDVPADLAGFGAGGGAAFGAGAEASLGAFNAALGAAAPIWAGLTAAVELIGEGKIPIISSILDMAGL